MTTKKIDYTTHQDKIDRVVGIVSAVISEIGAGPMGEMMIADAVAAGMPQESDFGINTAVRDFFASACSVKPAGVRRCGDYFWKPVKQ